MITSASLAVCTILLFFLGRATMMSTIQISVSSIHLIFSGEAIEVLHANVLNVVDYFETRHTDLDTQHALEWFVLMPPNR